MHVIIEEHKKLTMKSYHRTYSCKQKIKEENETIFHKKRKVEATQNDESITIFGGAVSFIHLDSTE